MLTMQILGRVRLAGRHAPTGATRHYRNGQLLPPPTALRIGRYETDAGYYLLYLDENDQEVSDTWHDTLEAAVKQAKLEFGVQAEDWELLS
jgi:hypothetical protein